jgi:hypothetical protein
MVTVVMTGKASESGLGQAGIHVPHRKKSGAEIFGHQVLPVTVPEIEQVPQKYIALALVHLRNQLARVAKMAEDWSLIVDEYTPMSLSPESELVLTVQPSYEITEYIMEVLVIGPAAATVTLQLGDRVWPLILPATGYISINLAPAGFPLSRSDVRQLTATVAGEYFLELMGRADNRY